MVAIMIDQREPPHIQQQFPDAVITLLETGDAWVACDDGQILMIERKTSSDLLHSLRSNRLMEQISRLVDPRHTQYLKGGNQTYWPYLIITGSLSPDKNGNVWVGRETGWNWNSLQGALLSIQEMGCYIVICPSDTEYRKTIDMLARRERKQIIEIAPQRIPVPVSAKEAFLSGLPEIGLERARSILEWSGNNLSHALCGLTDLSIKVPVGDAVRRKIRGFLDLAEHQIIDLTLDEKDREQLIIKEDKHV